MWVVGLLVVVVVAVAAAVAYRTRRRSVAGTMPATTSRPAGDGPRWAERAADLSATKPSQAQATESPAQQQAPRAADS